MTKTQLIATLQTKNPTLTKSDISGVLDSLSETAIEILKSDGAVVVPGLVKLKAVTKPATPERQGVDPFTKQPKTFAARPESKKVKASPVKTVKDALGA